VKREFNTRELSKSIDALGLSTITLEGLDDDDEPTGRTRTYVLVPVDDAALIHALRAEVFARRVAAHAVRFGDDEPSEQDAS
jgi:hypothetical protein